MAKFVKELTDSQRPILSIEVTPPNRGESDAKLLSSIESLTPYNLKYINITTHQSFLEYIENDDKITKIFRTKKPGTVGMSMKIRKMFNIETIPHIIVAGNTKHQLEDQLIDLHYLGFENIFVVRGDSRKEESVFIPHEDGHRYAGDLVRQIDALNNGVLIDGSASSVHTNFTVGVASYPEKHIGSPNFADDLIHTQEKIDYGASYTITQMGFTVDSLIAFQNSLKRNIPIIPGIKPITSLKQMQQIPRTFFVDIPSHFVTQMSNAKTRKEEIECGVNFSVDYIERLLEHGFKGIHIFTMGRGKTTKKILERMGGVFNAE